jgi:hypothetical protein
MTGEHTIARHSHRTPNQFEVRRRGENFDHENIDVPVKDKTL